MITRNAGYTKDFNQKLILSLLRHQSLSRADIARVTGLSRSAISIITEELLSQNLVEESESQIIPKGRRPVLLQLCGKQSLSVGVYLDRSNCYIGVVDMKGSVLAYQTVQFSKSTVVYKSLDIIADTINQLLVQIDVKPSQLMGLGFSAPGPVDTSTGLIINPPSFEKWHYTNIKSHLEGILPIDVELESNAYSLSLFEKNFFTSTPNPTFLYVLVGVGVGSGFVSKGHLYRGSHGLSGELGHVSINQQGPPCSCGNRGCLEIYASIPYLLKSCHAKTDWAQTVLDANNGDSKALGILQQEARYLAAGIINAVNMLDVDTVLLGGDIIDAFDMIAPMIRQRVNNMSLINSFGEIKILPSHSGGESNVLAAANIVYENYFSDITV